MLRSTELELWSPNAIRRPSQSTERVRDGWTRRWSGYGTFKTQTTRQSTQDLGRAAQLTAIAHSRAVPESLLIKVGSWQLAAAGRFYEINNFARSGNLTTFSLTEAEAQSVNHD